MAGATGSTIFVSCGPDCAAHEAFVAAIERRLQLLGFEPRTVGRQTGGVWQPLPDARRLIGRCDGAVVIAFERTRILQGIEKPHAPDAPQPAPLGSLPTVWCQLEAAMAYAKDVPILVLVDEGVKRQGMLSDKSEWRGVQAPLTTAFLETEAFDRTLRSWVELVEESRARRAAAPAATTAPAPGDPQTAMGHILKGLSRMTMAETLAVIAAVFAALSTVATVSFGLGQKLAPAAKPPAAATAAQPATPPAAPAAPPPAPRPG